MSKACKLLKNFLMGFEVVGLLVVNMTVNSLLESSGEFNTTILSSKSTAWYIQITFTQNALLLTNSQNDN